MKQTQVLLVDDDASFRELMEKELSRRDLDVTSAASGSEAVDHLDDTSVDVVVLDLKMPGMDGQETLETIRQADGAPEVVLLTGHGSIEAAIEAMRAGAHDFLTKPCKVAELTEVIRKAAEVRQLRQENALHRRAGGEEADGPVMIGSSPALNDVRKLIRRAAPTEATVLITGPSGSGKELVAKAIHAGSDRRRLPLVTLNCAALNESVLESELFGHEKGAFTGATTRRSGLFEVAAGGTLFLDEIGEMGSGVQAKVLRVLESGEFRPVGASRTRKADVRLIAATNRSPERAVEEGRLREDLLFRLDVIRIEVPPLRDRPSDIPLLCDHFLETCRPAGRERLSLTERAGEALQRYRWPGNVRELKNVMERLAILTDGPSIDVTDLPTSIRDATYTPLPGPDGTPPSLEEMERAHILKTLRHTEGNRAQAAEILGIAQATLYAKLKKYREEDGLDV